MAPGYVIALALEAAGLVGLVLGFARLRAERQARAAGLRGLLLTGNAAIVAAGPRAVSPAPRRVVMSPVPAEREQDAFAARTALHRALGVYSQPERKAA
jgi:hypothetical protein